MVPKRTGKQTFFSFFLGGTLGLGSGGGRSSCKGQHPPKVGAKEQQCFNAQRSSTSYVVFLVGLYSKQNAGSSKNQVLGTLKRVRHIYVGGRTNIEQARVAEERAALLEYELRVCREDLEEAYHGSTNHSRESHLNNT
eukprot:5366927-Amphidinium_carterae.1